MKVYKFGGASIKSADGVRNLFRIAKMACDNGERLIVVVSAMGKTTNAIEEVLYHYTEGNLSAAISRLEQIREYHEQIMDDLSLSDRSMFEDRFSAFENIIRRETPTGTYESTYDSIVSYGELLSSSIVCSYLNEHGLRTKLTDMRSTLITDDRFREASVDFETSTQRLKEAVGGDFDICLMQGFIGGTIDGRPTTLGREGSDYTAAAVANMLDCDSVTIWKDVEGIFSADPRLFPSATLIERLSYVDAVELAYSGAQIIHPKTIKPLRNKNIPLYVRPFDNPEAEGSCIKDSDDYTPPQVPILILKRNQILISLEPKDFSFVLEESLEKAFSILNRHRQKVNLVQTSAIRISVSVDASRYFSELIEDLKSEFAVRYNDNLELLTIRGYLWDVVERESVGHTIYIKQQTRRSVKLLRNSTL